MHLSGRLWKIEDFIRLLVADTGLASWEETQRVENMRRKMKLERERAERDHARSVAAEKAVGEERRRLARRIEQASKAEEVQKAQVEAARLRNEQIAVAGAALEVCVEECVKAMTPEELVPRAAKVSEAAKGVKRAEAAPSPVGEDVDVGGG